VNNIGAAVCCSGDYQKLYKDVDLGSDDDGGGESDDGKRKKSSASKSSRPATGKSRTKECPGCGSRLPISVKVCTSCDYLFTSKSMLMAASQQSVEEESQTIRDKFPFEPERVLVLYYTFALRELKLNCIDSG
jgi:hypothetical protein